MDKLTLSFYGAVATLVTSAVLLVARLDSWRTQRQRDKALFGRNQIVDRLMAYEFQQAKQDPRPAKH